MKELCRPGGMVMGSFVDALNWDEVLERIHKWSQASDSRYVCTCNTHSLITASRNPEFQRVINEADMATPDGAPIAWMLRWLGFGSQPRISGPELMWKYCEAAAARDEPVLFYGNSGETLVTLQKRLLAAFPNLSVVGAYSPPFRPLTAEEDAHVVKVINESGAKVIFVSLGCPKQELWIAAHRGRIQGVMIGVGAAFDFHAGVVRRAPRWMRDCGLEWLYRFGREPRRLWKRYLITNTLFVIAVLKLLATKGNKKSVTDFPISDTAEVSLQKRLS